MGLMPHGDPSSKRGMNPMRVIAIGAAILLSAIDAKAAETTWDVIEQFGLQGVWSASCEKLATAKGFRTIFAKGPDGSAIREIDFGAGYPIRRTIVEDAQLISPSKLKIRVRNTDPNWGKFDNSIHEAVLIKEDDPKTKETIRFRAIDSVVLTTGEVLVKDGIRTSTGRPSFWDYKCRSTMS